MLSSTKTTLWGLLLLCFIYYAQADYDVDNIKNKRTIHFLMKKRELYNPDLSKAGSVETLSSIVTSLSSSIPPLPKIIKRRRRLSSRRSKRQNQQQKRNTQDTDTDTSTDTDSDRPVCGNNIRERGEQCDGGECCDINCKFKIENTPCRATEGDCDLPDTCSGHSAECHDDHQSQAYICNTSPCTVCGNSTTTCPEVTESTCSGVGECDIDNGGCDHRVTCSVESGSRVCGSCPLGTSGDGFECHSLCGDETCDATIGENCVTCPQDCKEDYCSKCGDSKCDANETCTTCPADCGPCVSAECENDCSGHGTCNNGLCICKSPFTGSACNLKNNEPIILSNNRTSPGLSLESPIITEREKEIKKFYISVSKFTEFSSNGESLRSVSIPSLSFSLSENYSGTNKLLNYSTQLQNGATVQILIWQFEENTNVEFAKTVTEFQQHTLKINVNIQNWPFYNLTNYLGIFMNNDLVDNNNQRIDNNNTINNDKIDDTGNLRWMKLKLQDISLYGQFLNKAIVDGRIRTISFSKSEDSVVAIIPHFWNYAEMDPHFTVLVDGADTEPGGGISTTTIVVAVCASVGGGALVAAAIVFTPKLVTKWQVRKKQKDLRADEKELDKQPQIMIEGMIEMSGLPKSNSTRVINNNNNNNNPNREKSVNAMGTYVVRL